MKLTKKNSIKVGILLCSIVLLSLGYRLYLQSKEYVIETEPTEIFQQESDFFQNEISENTDSLSEVTVFVSGEVIEPKVVTLQQGMRLVDAIDKCGGMTKEADLNRTNLALILEDEGHYVIPKIGEELIQTFLPTGQTNENTPGKVNINKASKEEIKTLPGIGDVLADRIIEKRDSLGGFKSIDDLQTVSGIGEKKFSDIKDKIIIK